MPSAVHRFLPCAQEQQRGAAAFPPSFGIAVAAALNASTRLRPFVTEFPVHCVTLSLSLESEEKTSAATQCDKE